MTTEQLYSQIKTLSELTKDKSEQIAAYKDLQQKTDAKLKQLEEKAFSASKVVEKENLDLQNRVKYLEGALEQNQRQLNDSVQMNEQHDLLKSRNDELRSQLDTRT